MTRRRALSAGQRFGRLVVIDPDARYKDSWGAVMRCDCGMTKTIAVRNLRRIRSCGCLQREATRQIGQVSSHGLARHPLYDTWAGMVRRCEQPSHKYYRNYGGRGISVCNAWHDAAAFITWMEANLGPRAAGMSLDRIDNDGDYEPGNVRWATRKQQRDNRRGTELQRGLV